MNRLRDICGNENILYNEPMKNHTSFRIGGIAKVVVMPESIEKLAKIIKYAKMSNISYSVVGNGSNLLVSDKGFDGIVIITNNINHIDVKENELTAGCGVSLMKLANTALSSSLTGLEFASGIPGTVGGGIVMNAGAYGGELKDVVKNITYCDSDGNICCTACEDADMSYRHSMFSDKELYVLEVTFKLAPGNKDDINARMQELGRLRQEKQPLNYPNAGSAFKRPEGYFAAKLIDDSGLKGFCIGDACVSEKHCGFIVNKGNATANDVYELIKHCIKVVYEKQGVVLEPEIKMLGEF